MTISRRKSRKVYCGTLPVGGDAPISIQTMTKVDSHDAEAVLAQVVEAVQAGADIVRMAVPDQESLRTLAQVAEEALCPIVADIHFDYRLALGAIEEGASKVRVNPGNIGSRGKLARVGRSARSHGVALRVGVNGGSLEKDILGRHGRPTPQALVESTMNAVHVLEDTGLTDIVLSVKSTDVPDTLAAYSLLAEKTDWPFHIGITEAGLGEAGVVKSSAGIAALLTLGLGDTLRVSLTGEPVWEVRVGQRILQSLGLGVFGPELISCPTCGRTQVNLVPIAERVMARLSHISVPLKVAVMGCPVNGPGEARQADVGIGCGRGGGVLFAHGKVLGTVPEEEIVEALVRLAEEEAQKRAEGTSFVRPNSTSQ